MKNTWPGGVRHAIDQKDHEEWNSKNYPGTLQLCNLCEEPTGRCEEDTIWNKEGEPICEDCAKKEEERKEE
ncbi:MAG: hypothetical protein ACTSXD_05705 [Candidatus Heimdallarchaeaceae archaeon]